VIDDDYTRSLFAILREYSGPGQAAPTNAVLCERTGWSERTVRAVIGRLAQGNKLSVKRAPGGARIFEIPPRNLVTGVCPGCNQEFVLPQRARNKIYCSQACSRRNAGNRFFGSKTAHLHTTATPSVFRPKGCRTVEEWLAAGGTVTRIAIEPSPSSAGNPVFSKVRGFNRTGQVR